MGAIIGWVHSPYGRHFYYFLIGFGQQFGKFLHEQDVVVSGYFFVDSGLEVDAKFQRTFRNVSSLLLVSAFSSVN